jgi:class 3 adenylate cyclase
MGPCRSGTNYGYRVYRLDQLFGQAVCFAYSLRQMSRGSRQLAAGPQDIVGRGRHLAKNLFA